MSLIPIADLAQLRFIPDGETVWAHFYMPQEAEPSMQGPLVVRDVDGGKQLYWNQPGKRAAFGPVLTFNEDEIQEAVIHHGELRAHLFHQETVSLLSDEGQLQEYLASQRSHYEQAIRHGFPFPVAVADFDRPYLTVMDYGVHVDVYSAARGFILRVSYHEGMDSFVATRFTPQFKLATLEQAPGSWRNVAPVCLLDEEELHELLDEISEPLGG